MSVKITTTTNDAQGARVIREDEHMSIVNAVDACRRFTQRQNRATYSEVMLAMRTLGIYSGWNRD